MYNSILKYFILGISMTFAFISCKNEPKNITIKQEIIKVPSFDKKQAFQYVQTQVDFGPRVPNTEEHTACKKWIINEMGKTGFNIIEQNFEAETYDNKTINGTNIIAQYKPELKKRILLMAHWDTRFISDAESDEDKKKLAVHGADDGASGVAVLMSIANAIKTEDLNMGVDFVFFDAEDQGESQGTDNTTWCLGSQYWSNNLHTKGYKAEFGILLDMVGSKNARFMPEYWSTIYAPQANIKVWKTAHQMGYTNLFVKGKPRPVTDDHYFVNTIAGIPSIDIINTTDTGTGFGAHWHTQDDNMDIIDKNTMKAVGSVVLNVLYKEAKGQIKAY